LYTTADTQLLKCSAQWLTGLVVPFQGSSVTRFYHFFFLALIFEIISNCFINLSWLSALPMYYKKLRIPSAWDMHWKGKPYHPLCSLYLGPPQSLYLGPLCLWRDKLCGSQPHM